MVGRPKIRESIIKTLMYKTCFSVKMPNVCTFILYYVVEMSAKHYMYCVGHVVRFLTQFLKLPEVIMG